jgi:hypothetical protein
MSTDSVKPCNKCGTMIASFASKCPQCQGWQSYRAYLRANPGTLFSGLFCIVILIPLFWFQFGQRGKDFENYREQVEIVTSKIQFNEGGFVKMSVLGWLKNNSPHKWTDIVLEVQLYDAKGQLVGADSEEMRDMVLLPGKEQAFQLDSSKNFPKDDIASHKLFIRNAKDASRWP